MDSSSVYAYATLKYIVFEDDVLPLYVCKIYGADGLIFISQSLVLADWIYIIQKGNITTSKECDVVLGHLQI